MNTDETRLLKAYFSQMQTATRYGYYAAIPSTDMLQLQTIYRHYLAPEWNIRIWCSKCCLDTLRGLYELTKTLL